MPDRKVRAWRLPWKREAVPHALLDIIRGCNVACRACYNELPQHIKSVDEVRDELDVLQRQRRLQMVSIVGGEVTLHPQLLTIVRMIRERGLHVELFTNGVLLTPAMAAEWKAAGVDLVFLHIEAGQRRADLPSPAGPEQVRQLLESKARMLAEQGIEAGYSVTSYDEDLADIRAAVRLTLDSPHIIYLLVTLARDLTNVVSFQGDLHGGLRGTVRNRSDLSHRGKTDNRSVCDFISAEFGLDPFCFIGSNVDADDPRWLSYMVATVPGDGSGRATVCRSLKASLCERAFTFLHYALKGSYPMYMRHTPARFRSQIVLNGLAGGGLLQNARFLARTRRLSEFTMAKRILFQNPATMDDAGRVVHCDNCPDAVVKNGRLVPVCISDKLAATD